MAVAQGLKDGGGLDVRECFIDGTFAPAKKGASLQRELLRRQGHEDHGSDGRRVGPPVVVCMASASPHEVTLVPATPAALLVEGPPERLVGDSSYDSDRLDAELVACAMDTVAPNRARCRRPIQDGHALLCIRRRWRVERLFAWPHNHQRLITRWDRKPGNFLGVLHLACALILLKRRL